MNLYMRNHAINHLLDVDSYGCIFMYATHCDLTTAPRHIIRMSEPVRPEELREALKIALLRFPQMGPGPGARREAVPLPPARQAARRAPI